MKIVISPYGWGEALPVDVLKLLRDVAFPLNRSMRTPFTGAIVVVPAPHDDLIPRTHYRFVAGDPFFIQLTALGRKWDQFAYQFSHELCHVLSDYERLRENPNNWFHEAICELASVFTLRRMAERWLTDPPYPHWADYAESLASYVQERLLHKENQLPVGLTLSAWLLSEEESLRKDCNQREKNAVVSYSLLPLFENEPTGWNAIRNLPDSSAMLRDYLRQWCLQVDPRDRQFVNRIIQLFQE